MKNFIKTSFIVAILLGTVQFSKAQDITGGVNVMLGLPMGTFGDAAGFGIGGGIEGNYFIQDKFSVGIEAGYLAFAAKDVLGIDNSATMIPVLAKATYFFMEDEFMPYASLGVGFYAVTTKIEGELLGVSFDSETDLGGFGISPRVGAQYEVGDGFWINANVQYNLLFNGETTESTVGGVTVETETDPTNYLGINVGVIFTLAD